MSVERKNDDSSDSDCFIVKEIKPVKKPLIQKTLFVKDNNASNILNLKKNKNNKTADKIRNASSLSVEVKSNKKQAVLNNSCVSSEKKSNSVNVASSKNRNIKPLICTKDISPEGGNKSTSEELNSDVTQAKKVDSYSEELQNSHNTWSPRTVSPMKAEYQRNKNTEEIQLSPGISRKRKRFIITEITPKSPSPKKNVKKPLLQMFDAIEDVQNPAMKEPSSDIFLGNTSSDADKFKDNSKLLSFLLKEMIKTEIKKHFALLLESDREVLEKFFNLKESACKLFVRMLGRKKSWHRVCDIIYKDISNNLEDEFELLHKANYVDVNIGDQDLKIQMDLLKKPEVLNLCKAFNVSFKFIDSSKKETLITSLIQECQKQKSALDMFKGKSSTARLDKLRSEVNKYLGMCIKLNSTTFLVFYKILLLSSFPHYFGEEDQRFTNELLVRSQVHKKIIKFPTYKLSSVIVFETLADFEEYRKAVLLQDSFEVAISNKNFEEFISIFLEVRQEFEKLLKNNE